MNIHEYISSGIIESYVLGLASEEERIEFEQMCARYPELVEARNNFELALEAQARRNATAPPPDVKEKIWSAIAQTVPKTSKVITMQPTMSRSPAWGWVAAASVILLLVAGYFAITLYNRNKDLERSNQNLVEKINLTDSILNRITQERRMMGDSNFTVVNMVGTQKALPGSANVYWDTTSSNVYLVVKNMPRLPSNKQYQLWALIEGKPLDLGLFDWQQPNVMLKMKNTQRADAFAITIENRGNTGGPNLEELRLMGKAKL